MKVDKFTYKEVTLKVKAKDVLKKAQYTDLAEEIMNDPSEFYNKLLALAERLANRFGRKVVENPNILISNFSREISNAYGESSAKTSHAARELAELVLSDKAFVEQAQAVTPEQMRETYKQIMEKRRSKDV
jgi:type IV secretory pathway ATPase VirB11/archaellum biosynthesis ATPase